MTSDKRVEEIVAKITKKYDVRYFDGSTYAVDEEFEKDFRQALTQHHQDMMSEVVEKPKEVIVKIDEFWQRECLESIFGSEDISNIHWDYNNDDTETEYEMECVLRRLPKPLLNLSK